MPPSQLQNTGRDSWGQNMQNLPRAPGQKQVPCCMPGEAASLLAGLGQVDIASTASCTRHLLCKFPVLFRSLMSETVSALGPIS